MTISFKQAFEYDASGYFEHEVTVQVVDGETLMPPSCTLETPWGKGVQDEQKFYRFDGKKWTAEAKPTCAADLVGLVVSHQSRTPRDREMRELIQKFGNETGYRITRGEDLSWSVEKIPEKTPEEKRAEAETSARLQRDRLLTESDYYLAPDYPSTPEGLKAVTDYRQALRDIPQQKGFPLEIVWPVKPDVLK